MRRSFSGELISLMLLNEGGGGGVEGLDGIFSVAVSPDGKHLYAAGINDDALVVLSVPIPR